MKYYYNEVNSETRLIITKLIVNSKLDDNAKNCLIKQWVLNWVDIESLKEMLL